MSSPDRVLDDMVVDHLGLYVDDLPAAAGWLVESYGLTVRAESAGAESAGADSAGAGSAGADSGGAEPGARSVVLGTGGIRLVLTEPGAGHRGADYLRAHGDGVADVALRVADATAAYELAVAAGARPVAAPARHGGLVTAAVGGFGDVVHTFVQRDGDAPVLPGLRPVVPPAPAVDGDLREIDHLAVCLPAGTLDDTVEFYQRVLRLRLIFTERITVGTQALVTKVVQSGSGGVTFTLIEPDVTRAPGHIDEFLAEHGGAGVQHVAFSTGDIVRAVERIGGQGVEFLGTPDAYYRQLPQRVDVDRHPLPDLHRLAILVDQDHDGQLFQIFARSVHPRGTLFYELIERLGARSFGSGNIAALYRAVEHQHDETGPDVQQAHARGGSS